MAGSLAGENRAATSRVSSPEVTPPSPRSAESAGPGPSQRIWSTEIPSRNRNFTGRLAELEALHANLTLRSLPHPPAQVISGMGGIGKTEIATEYIHRHRDEYEIIWWIRAEHHDRVRDALSASANGWNCDWRAQAAAATGRSRPSWSSGIGNPASMALGVRQRRSALSKGICPRARPAATSSSPRGCRTGRATSRLTVSRSRHSPKKRPSASCAAGCPSSAAPDG